MFKQKFLRALIWFAALMFAFAAFTPAAKASVDNGIVRPVSGTTISGWTSVHGVADDPNFLAWQLDLIPQDGKRDTIFVQRGTRRVSAPGHIGRIDTGLYPNGEYQLRLRVIRADGNYSEYFSNVFIDNDPHASNGITNVIEGIKLGCLETIKGIARADDFNKYQIDLLVNGDENKTIMLERGNQPRYAEGNLTQVDLTTIPDGDYVLRLRVVHRDGNYDAFYSRISVDNAIMKDALNRHGCGCTPPAPDTPATEPNGITEPPNGLTVVGTIPICGVAYDAALDAWQMDLLFNGDEDQAVLIAHGETPNLDRNPFTLFDTTVLPDGRYVLRLRIARDDQTVTQYETAICVHNNALSVTTIDCTKVKP